MCSSLWIIGLSSYTKLLDMLWVVVLACCVYIICMRRSKLFKVVYWDLKLLTSPPFLTFPGNFLFLWIEWWWQWWHGTGHYSVVRAAQWEHFATCRCNMFFIICFIFTPLLITLNETATSRDDSRACFSLWVYCLCFGFLQTAYITDWQCGESFHAFCIPFEGKQSNL